MRVLRAATLTVPDPAAALACWAAWFDYRAVEHGIVAEDLAFAWGSPGMEGRPFTLARPASGADVFLRFVAGETPAGYRPLRSFGWAAIELCVQDVASLPARLAGSPFEIIGPPRPLDGMPSIIPMQVRGPHGEIVYLTEIRDDLPGIDMPRAACPVDRLFIAVLACADLGRSIEWFERTLELRFGPETAITYTMLNKAFDLPAGRKHRIATGLDGRNCLVELDQYPPQATVRPRDAGALPPGVALVTLAVPSLDRIDGDWIRPPQQQAGMLYAGRRAGTLRAPDDTLVELVEMQE